MLRLTDHPLLLFALSYLSLSFSVWVGKAVGAGRHPLESETRKDFDVVLAATLTLLGLIIGFSFSMALGRYDLRRNCEAEEANAIGTEYLGVELLSAADSARARALLLEYLDKRIEFYETLDGRRLRQIGARTAKLESGMWEVVRADAVARPQAVTALAAKGMNDVLNSRGYTLAAWINRIPAAAWALMFAIAALSNLMIGYGARSPRKAVFLIIFPLVVSVAFLLIADIDCPRGGLIRVLPQNLLSLFRSLHPR